jgi:hypothetical protein
MFSLFKKKPKFSDEPLEQLSDVLANEKENPTYRREFFDIQKLDYSIESLKHIDEYLDELHAQQPDDSELLKIVLRCGAYVGEVIRRNASIEYHWLEFSEAAKISKYVRGIGMQLGVSAVLWARPDNICFPLAKVLKFIENGSEDSTYFFAEVAIQGLPKS